MFKDLLIKRFDLDNKERKKKELKFEALFDLAFDLEYLNKLKGLKLKLNRKKLNIKIVITKFFFFKTTILIESHETGFFIFSSESVINTRYTDVSKKQTVDHVLEIVASKYPMEEIVYASNL